MVVKEINESDIQQQVIKLFDHEIRRNFAFYLHHPEKIISVFFQRLTSSPLAVLNELYDKANFSWTKSIEDTTRKYVVKNPKSRRGIHRHKGENTRDAFPESFKNYKLYFSAFL